MNEFRRGKGAEPLIEELRKRFETNKGRHGEVGWAEVLERLNAQREKLRALDAMEQSGGELDVMGRDSRTGEILFADCAAESPAGRRSLCYDEEALAARKQNKPAGSARGMAARMGVELMTEEEYRTLQALGEFDTKTSSWLLTPEPIRARGGALFGDRRDGAVFTYHNGADSYYAARGFRAILRV